MRQVKHPKHLYVQLNDEDPQQYGMAITDRYDTADGDTLDPNALDNETRQRLLHMLKTAYAFIYDHSEEK